MIKYLEKYPDLEFHSDGTIWRKQSEILWNYTNCSKNRILSRKKLGGKKLTPKGYIPITYYKKHLRVHRLICEAFHGPPIGNKNQVNHKNGIKTDNRPENLEWVTLKENIKHSVKNKLHGFGEKISKKLKNEDILEIRNLYKKGISQRKIAKKYNVSHSTIGNIVRLKWWKHV